MGFTDKELEKYYRKGDKKAEAVIKQFLKDSTNAPVVVYGARAVNAYLPSWLDKDTKDWDILTEKNAKEQAGQLEKLLDKRYGGDYFEVEPAVHEGTFRIRSKVTGETLVDVTREEDVEYRKIGGIRYVPLESIEQNARKTLKDTEAAYRHRKDKDTLQRIRIYRKRRKRPQAGLKTIEF